MTETQKKAKELIEKYKKLIDDNDLHCALGSEQDFAILCVDEILKSIDRIWFSFCEDNNIDKTIFFWQEVRNDIINYKN